MKIAMICDVLGAPNNGTTVATLNLIKYLREAGHEVTVVCSDVEHEGEDGYVVVPTLYLGKFIQRIIERNGVSLSRCGKKAKVKLEKLIAESDVVHIQVPFLLGTTAVKIAKKLNKPLTASFHCQAENVTSHLGLMNCAYANNVVYRFIYKHVFSKCDKIHYPTQFIREVFESKTAKTNGEVISNGVNDSFTCGGDAVRTSDKFTIFCTGRYCKEKNQAFLIDAVAASKYRDDITLVLAGCGPDEKKLKKRAKKRGVDCRFNFYSRDDLTSALRGADLYVHSATVEIEAISCLEAIACGLVPVIASSPRSATRYFALGEENLYDYKSTASLTERIEFWLENPDKRKECKDNYANNFTNISQAEAMRRMETMLRCAVEEKSGSLSTQVNEVAHE